MPKKNTVSLCQKLLDARAANKRKKTLLKYYKKVKMAPLPKPDDSMAEIVCLTIISSHKELHWRVYRIGWEMRFKFLFS